MKNVKIVAALLMPVLINSTLLLAETPEEIRARWEQGPRTIDVSAYPGPIQENYQVFANRCKKCHNLSRPVNSDYALPSEWQRYVKRMMRKPGSGISKKDGKKIYEFLAYDSSVRKRDLVEEKLNTLSSEERKAEEEKIAELKARY